MVVDRTGEMGLGGKLGLIDKSLNKSSKVICFIKKEV
jgi:hypothetical protein